MQCSIWGLYTGMYMNFMSVFQIIKIYKCDFGLDSGCPTSFHVSCAQRQV